MNIQSFPKLNLARPLPGLSAQSQKPDPQEPRESFISGPVAGVVGAGLGGSLGVWAGASHGLLPGAASVALGAAGGALVGALVGSLIATSNPWDHNEWNDFRGAQMGALPGALVGGVAGALAHTSPLTGLVLGVAGVATGALVGRFLAEQRG